MIDFTIQCPHCKQPISIRTKPHTDSIVADFASQVLGNEALVPDEYIGESICECGHLVSIMLSIISINMKELKDD